MVRSMENKKSLLLSNEIQVTEKIKARIPTVGEVLLDESSYYETISYFIATPYSLMVQLDDIGLDFTKMSDYDLFLVRYPSIFRSDLSIIFGDTFKGLYEYLSREDVSDLDKYKALYHGTNPQNGTVCVYDAIDDILMDELVFSKMADTVRSINLMERDKRKAGNEKAAEYLIEKNRRYARRHKNDKYKPFLENLVVSLVNKQEFKYNYEETMDMSIYTFNRSFEQVKHAVNFDKVMNGVYAGTVDTSKMTDKSVLSFIQT